MIRGKVKEKNAEGWYFLEVTIFVIPIEFEGSGDDGDG